MNDIKITVMLWPANTIIRSIRHIGAWIETCNPDQDEPQKFYLSFGGCGSPETDTECYGRIHEDDKLVFRTKAHFGKLVDYCQENFPNNFASFYMFHKRKASGQYPLPTSHFTDLPKVILNLLEKKDPDIKKIFSSRKKEDEEIQSTLRKTFGLITDLSTANPDDLVMRRFFQIHKLYQIYYDKYQLTTNNCSTAVSSMLCEAKIITQINNTPPVLFHTLKIKQIDQHIREVIDSTELSTKEKMLFWLLDEKQRLEQRLLLNLNHSAKRFKHENHKQKRIALFEEYHEKLQASRKDTSEILVTPDELQQLFDELVTQYQAVGSSKDGEIERLKHHFEAIKTRQLTAANTNSFRL